MQTAMPKRMAESDSGDPDDLEVKPRPRIRFTAYACHEISYFVVSRGVLLTTPTIVVLEGDQTGQELLAEALRVLDKSVIDLELAFERFDLSLENRRATNNQVVLDAAEAVKKHGLGLKAATITPEQKGDVGSPNAILRRAIEGKVIVRTGRKLPRVRPVAGIHAPISVVRMAVGDAYGAKEWRRWEGGDEIACRTEIISRDVCRYVAEYAFVQAAKIGGQRLRRPQVHREPGVRGDAQGRDGRRGRAPSARSRTTRS